MRLRNRRREEEDLRCVVLQMEFWGMASIFFGVWESIPYVAFQLIFTYLQSSLGGGWTDY